MGSEDSHGGDQNKDLIDNSVGDIEMKIVKVKPTWNETIGKNAESVQVEGVQNEDRKVQESERAESCIVPFLRFQRQCRSQRDKFEEQKNIRNGEIWHRAPKYDFVRRPEDKADQPHETTEGDEQPKTANMRMAALEILKRQYRSASDQNNLNSVAQYG